MDAFPVRFSRGFNGPAPRVREKEVREKGDTGREVFVWDEGGTERVRGIVNEWFKTLRSASNL